MPSAAAASPVSQGGLSCRADAVRIGPGSLIDGSLTDPIASNRPNTPCLLDKDSLIPSTVIGPVTAAALETATFQVPGGTSIAHAKIASVDIAGALGGVAADALQSRATATCNPTTFGGSSTVANLVIGTNPPINGSAPATVALGPFVTVFVNETDTTTDPLEVVHRAVRIHFLVGPDIVLAESRADCGSTPT